MWQLKLDKSNKILKSFSNKKPLRIHQVRNQGVFEKKAKISLKLFLGLTVHFLVNKLFKNCILKVPQLKMPKL